MYDNPGIIHRIMTFLSDAHMDLLDYLEDSQLLTLNNDGTYVGQGGFGWTKQLPQPDFGGTVRLCGLWGQMQQNTGKWGVTTCTKSFVKYRIESF